jgi:hypothetical protein
VTRGAPSVLLTATRPPAGPRRSWQRGHAVRGDCALGTHGVPRSWAASAAWATHSSKPPGRDTVAVGRMWPITIHLFSKF